jgi:hypothetical protein
MFNKIKPTNLDKDIQITRTSTSVRHMFLSTYTKIFGFEKSSLSFLFGLENKVERERENEKEKSVVGNKLERFVCLYNFFLF